MIHKPSQRGTFLYSSAILFLGLLYSGSGSTVYAQRSPSTTVVATDPAPQLKRLASVDVCRLSPKSSDCLEARISDLANRTEELEAQLKANGLADLLRRVDEAIAQHSPQGGKADLAGDIKNIWQAIDDLRAQIRH
jgi:hypothetical protein